MKTKTMKNNEEAFIYPGQLQIVEEKEKVEVIDKSDVGFSGFENLQKITKDYEDYLNLTEDIKGSMEDIFDNYINIGRRLLEVKDKELYKLANFKDIFDYAKENFEISKTTVNNVTNIVSKFCNEHGYLLPEFKDYSYSTLVEMVSVKQLDLANYAPTMTVKEIRLQKVVDKINELLDVQFSEDGFLTQLINHTYSIDFNKKLKTTAFKLNHKITKNKYEDELSFEIIFELTNSKTKQKIKFSIKYVYWKKGLLASFEGFYYGDRKYFYSDNKDINNLKDYQNWITKIINELVSSTGAIKSETTDAQSEEKKARSYESIKDYSEREDEYRDAPKTFFAKILANNFNNYFLEIPNYEEIHVFKESKISKKNPPAFKIINYRNPLELIVEDSDGKEFRPANIEELFIKEVTTLLDNLKE